MTTTSESTGLRIVQLDIENVKRLHVVAITPDEHVQIIGGANSQGKTSVLDAIWLALGGRAASQSISKPVRDGEGSGHVQLDLGEMIVTRFWTLGKAELRVESASGARFPSPQAMLDSLVGRLSFDPLEFTRRSARDQAAALLDLIDLPFDLTELDAERQRLYDERTAAGREARRITSHVAELGPVDDTLPTEEVASGGLFTELREGQRHNAERSRLQQFYRDAVVRRDNLRRELKKCEEEIALRDEQINATPIVDIDAIEAKLTSLDQTNAGIRANAQRVAARQQADQAQAGYDGLTAKIEELDATKSKALAEARFPVDGLGFDDSGVTYQGIPFGQASASEQIRVSLAMAMALNPKLRVIRILDGSLLDADNLRLIRDMARENDYQVWIERVGDGDETAVIIEDGTVRS